VRLLPLILYGTTLIAQEVQARFTAGSTIFADDGPVYEATFGGSVRFYFTRRWSIEPEFLHARRASGSFRDRNYFVWGNVAFDFLQRDRRIVPYWYAAPGLIRHTTSAEFREPIGRPGLRFPSTTHEASFGTGVGVRFRLSNRVFVAPQVRIGIADGIFTEITGSIGYVLRH